MADTLEVEAANPESSESVTDHVPILVVETQAANTGIAEPTSSLHVEEPRTSDSEPALGSEPPLASAGGRPHRTRGWHRDVEGMGSPGEDTSCSRGAGGTDRPKQDRHHSHDHRWVGREESSPEDHDRHYLHGHRWVGRGEGNPEDHDRHHPYEQGMHRITGERPTGKEEQKYMMGINTWYWGYSDPHFWGGDPTLWRGWKVKQENTVTMGIMSGGMAAAARTLWAAPLTRVKILLQMQSISTQLPASQRYKGMVDCFLRVHKEQGFFSLWRGNLGTVAYSFSKVALSFALNDVYKNIFLHDVDKNTQYWRHFAGSIAVGSAAGVTASLAIYPLYFSSIRLGADVARNVTERQFYRHIDCYENIFKSEGIRGLYKGLGTSVAGTIVYRGAYFGLYDIAKTQSMVTKNIPYYKDYGLAFCAAFTAGIIAYPLDTVRVRLIMQSGRTAEQVLYKNTVDCFKKMIAQEGFRPFYNGILPSLLKAPLGGLMLFAWGKLSK